MPVDIDSLDFFGKEKYSDTIPSITDSINSINSVLSEMNMLEEQLKNAKRQAKPKRKNTGKIFEKLVKDSANKQYGVSIDRIYDSNYTGDNSVEGVRFTHSNMADFILHNKKGVICWLEAKSTGTSLEFGDSLDVAARKQKAKQKIDKGGIRQKKLLFAKSERSKADGLRDVTMIGLIIEFKRNGEQFETWYVDIDHILWMERNLGKKSFNTKDLQNLYNKQITVRTFPIRLYKPKRARKDYLDIESMMKEGE